MPTTPMPPHDRFFARIEKFQCVCPGCGRLLLSTQDNGNLPAALINDEERRRKQRRKQAAQRYKKQGNDLVWNPYTQRLTCPWCKLIYVAGLLLYPAPKGPMIDAPPDTRPTRSERLERARIAGGYQLARYTIRDPVNVAVPDTCSCPEKGWVASCAIHGTRPAEVETTPA